MRRLKISYSDAEGLPVAYLFHKRILRRSLQAFVPDAGFALFFEEQEDSVRDDGEGISDISDEELEMKIKEKWLELSQSDRDEYAKSDQSNSSCTTMSGRAGFLAKNRMMAYREELLRWLVDLIRSPLPFSAIHWYVSAFSLASGSCCLDTVTGGMRASSA